MVNPLAGLLAASAWLAQSFQQAEAQTTLTIPVETLIMTVFHGIELEAKNGPPTHVETETTSTVTSSDTTTTDPATYTIYFPGKNTKPITDFAVTYPPSDSVQTIPMTTTVITSTLPDGDGTTLSTASVPRSTVTWAVPPETISGPACQGCVKPQPTPLGPDEVDRVLDRIHARQFLEDMDRARGAPAPGHGREVQQAEATARKVGLKQGLALGLGLGLPSEAFLSWVGRQLASPAVRAQVRQDDLLDALERFGAVEDPWEVAWDEPWLRSAPDSSAGRDPGEDTVALGRLGLAGVWWATLGYSISSVAYTSGFLVAPSPPMVGHYGWGIQLEDENSFKEGLAVHAYEAADVDEISFERGEKLRDIVHFSSGWSMGTNKDDQTGFFPDNYMTQWHPELTTFRTVLSTTTTTTTWTPTTSAPPETPGVDPEKEEKRRKLEEERRRKEEERKKKEEEERKNLPEDYCTYDGSWGNWHVYTRNCKLLQCYETSLWPLAPFISKPGPLHCNS